MKVINVDLDGVVYPWHEIMALWCWELAGNDIASFNTEWEWDHGNYLPYPAPNKWDFAAQWGMTEAELHSAARLGVDANVVWSQGKPIAGSVQGLWDLDNAGFYIRLVTQRLVHKNNHSVVQSATAKWLDRWNVPYHELIYMGHKSSKGDYRAGYAIDDSISNVNVMRKAGIDAYLLERPWNLKERGVIPTVIAWSELVATVISEDYVQLEAWTEDQGVDVSEGSSDSP